MRAVSERGRLSTGGSLFITRFRTLLIVTFLTRLFAACVVLSVMQIEKLSITGMDERRNFMHFLTLRRCVVVAVTSRTGCGRFQQGFGVPVEFPRLQGCDYIAHGRGRRCLAFAGCC